MIDPTVRSSLGDFLDRTVRSLEGRADVTKTQPTTIQHLATVTECVQTFTVQTYRVSGERDPDRGDTVTISFTDAHGSVRIVLPPRVTAAIDRQRGALTGKNRRASAKLTAEKRKAAGIQPAFLKGKKRKGSPR